MDKFTNMRAFTKVVDQGSFAGAAREMGLSRSVISKYIIDLETALRVQLLNRTTHNAAPTEVGWRYYERCVAILADVEDAEMDATKFQVEARGTLRVNAPMTFGTMYIGKLIAAFMAEHPALQVELVLSDELLNMVQEGFDLTISLTESPSGNLIARKLARASRVLCASPAYLAACGPLDHPKDLQNHRCLNYGYLATGTQWRLSGREGDHWHSIAWNLCSNNGEVLRDAAVDGAGIAMLPRFIVSDDLKSGKLKTVLDEFRAPSLAVFALYPPTRYVQNKVRVFIDYLVDHFGSSFELEDGGPLVPPSRKKPKAS